MSAPGPRVPLALRLAALLLPRDVRDEVLGDLLEHWNLHVRPRAFPARLVWAWRQPLSALGARLRFRARTGSGAALRRRGRGSVPAAGRRVGVALSWLDVKLGLRMLVKHPGLTLVSGLAMSVTIAIAIGMFSVFQDFLLRPVVPLPEGERIVSIGMLATERGLTHRQLLHDFFVWRDELDTVEGVSIWRRAPQNLVSADGRGEPASIAMMSASGFEVARVPPLMGRPLLDSDEVPGAPPVLVIGYDTWQRRFEGDPDIVGRTVQIGRDVHTIVGVMPEGFRFPLAEQFWIPFTDDPDDWAVMETPRSYFAFGRLASGATMAAAQAEIAAISTRRSAELPESYEHVRAIVMPYTDTHTGMDNAGSTIFVRIMLGVFSIFVLIPFVNVAILVYARTATRAGEITIRSALGASRRRVVTQLFIEALVLASLAAVGGVGLVLFVMSRVRAFIAGLGVDIMPFWAKNGQDPWAMAYVVALTLLAAVVAGVIPGLKATGKGVRTRLNQAGNANGMRLGGGWTALIVTQVAITVAFLPFVGSAGWQMIGFGLSRPTFDAQALVAARIRGDPMADLEGPASEEDPEERRAAREAASRDAIQEVIRRIEADPRVAGLTLASNIPGTLFEGSILLDVEGVDPPEGGAAHRVGGGMSVADDFFEVIGVSPTSGRVLRAADAEAEAPPIMVNRRFVETVLGGANPIGRRVRWYRGPDQEPGPWREIVGLVEDMVMNPTHPQNVEGRVFMPLDESEMADGAYLIVRAPGSVSELVPELRRITTGVDPTLRLGTAVTIGELDEGLGTLMGAALVGFGLVFISVLLLCSAGVFSLMSFNVTQRRREIGVRSALGADPGRVLTGVMARAARQLAIGVAVGLVVVLSMPPLNLDGIMVTATGGPIAVVALVMLGVGLLAAIGPARRGLRIHPSEALREG